MSVGFARLNLDEKIPMFGSLEEWETKKSTKIDTCARMCRHMLTRDDAPEIIVKDGVVCYPPVPDPAPGTTVSRETKILIYQEFPSLGPLLRNVSFCSFPHTIADNVQVLDLYGITYTYIDGQTSFQQRAKIVKRFCEDSSCRVLIISSVGSAGLNLSVASVIIFLVGPPFVILIFIFHVLH